MMRMVGKYWRGVRYIIRTLEQKAEGIQQVDLSDDNEGLPADLLALLESAAERPTADGEWFKYWLADCSGGTESRRHGQLSVG